MPSNLAIDDALLDEALRIGGKRTKRETVEEALREYVAFRKRLRAIEEFGTVEFDEQWDYKKARKSR